MFVCAYCGKEFKTIQERCQCEQECGKKQAAEIHRKKQEELIRIKKDRDDEITNAVKCLAKQIDNYHTDYHEMCSAECSLKYRSICNDINIMDLLHNLRIL